ncbi:MAG: alpha/beta hydrolase [Candidatus Korobacteraceae bacterium]
MTQGKIRSFFLEGPAGRLESLLTEGSGDTTHAAVVAHPHPLYGGTMHNKVVFHAMKALNSLGLPVLRFNFRGTGLSEGEYSGGRGGAEDVRAALDWLDKEFHLPLVFAGFSFGAAVGMKASCADERVKATVAIGTPMHISAEQAAQSGGPAEARSYEFPYLHDCKKPKLFVSGAEDAFATPLELEQLVAQIPEPKQLVLIDRAGHFFDGHLDEMRSAVERWVQETVHASSAKP